MIRVAEARATDLSKERSAVAEPFLLAVHGSLAALKNNRAEAAKLLRLSSTAFDNAQYKLYAAAIRMQLARLMDGEAAASITAEGEAVMKEEAVVKPERVSAMLAPVILASFEA